MSLKKESQQGELNPRPTYSDLNEETGFAVAARIDCQLTVNPEIRTETIPASASTPIPRSVWKAKSFSQSFITK